VITKLNEHVINNGTELCNCTLSVHKRM